MAALAPCALQRPRNTSRVVQAQCQRDGGAPIRPPSQNEQTVVGRRALLSMGAAVAATLVDPRFSRAAETRVALITGLQRSRIYVATCMRAAPSMPVRQRCGVSDVHVLFIGCSPHRLQLRNRLRDCPDPHGAGVTVRNRPRRVASFVQDGAAEKKREGRRRRDHLFSFSLQGWTTVLACRSVDSAEQAAARLGALGLPGTAKARGLPCSPSLLTTTELPHPPHHPRRTCHTHTHSLTGAPGRCS